MYVYFKTTAWETIDNNLTNDSHFYDITSTSYVPAGGGRVVDPHLHPFRNARPTKHDARKESQLENFEIQWEKDLCTELLLQSTSISRAGWDSVTSTGWLFSHSAAAHAFIDRFTPSRSSWFWSTSAARTIRSLILFLRSMRPTRRRRKLIARSGRVRPLRSIASCQNF